ncbi:hypothetical protein ABH966_003621 [Lysinibacillus sp. RC46]|uniref:pre-toxin TG domain-containing protein n=1 Tax=Lysinibacillus sp. RC46 TaxID=3156295 RepID=UPI0035143B95
MKKAVLAGKKAVKKAKKYAKTVVKVVKKTAKKVAVAAKNVNVRQAISTAADFIPVVGNAKAAFEAAFGFDPITKTKLSALDRGIAAAGVLGGGFAKAAGKGGKAAVKYYSGSKKTAAAAPKKAPTTGGKKAAAAPAKPAAKPAAKSENKIFTGAGIKDYDKAAEAEYEMIRKAKMKDVEDVAQNTGMSIAEIRTMKKHLFFGKHQIPQPGGKEYKLERFGADDEIAFAWKTAQKKELSVEQKAWFKQLAEHELTERKFMAEGQKYRTLESWNKEKGIYDGFPPGAQENAPPQPNTSFPGYEEYFFNNMFK